MLGATIAATLRRARRTAVVAACAAALAGALGASSGMATAGAASSRHHTTKLAMTGTGLPTISAPKAPPTSHPSQPAGFQSPTELVAKLEGRSASIPAHGSVGSTPAAPSEAVTWGSGPKSTLVLYDNSGTWAYLGEIYAELAGNLASHFGTVTAEPVVDYVATQLSGYNAAIYIGSTYNESIPTTFLNNVLAGTTPVMWLGDNIWELSGTGSAESAFETTYGWDPSTSYFDTKDTVVSVSYNGETFTRNALDGPVLAPHITNSALVTQLGQANCDSATGASQKCSSLAQAPGGPTATSFPWAIESANLIYVGEIPFSYMNQTDRYIAFSGLLYNLLDPDAAPSHLALVRLEDLSPADTPTQLVHLAEWLHTKGVPFSMNIISDYKDPSGYYTGKPLTLPLDGTDQTSIDFVNAIKEMMSLGGTLNMEGYTHQYTAPGTPTGKATHNPFSGVSGDDFEFYRAQCSTTQTAPYHFVTTTGTYTATLGIYRTTCPYTDYVIEEGPVATDSTPSWASGRIESSIDQFHSAGIPVPRLYIFPHYAASARDYNDVAQLFPSPSDGAYDERIYYYGLLTGGGTVHPTQADDTIRVGQLFPYVVHDLYGSTVIPENLGTYEATQEYGNPPRTGADIIAEAQDNLAVPQGFASFFFDPDFWTTGTTGILQTIVNGVQNLGYTFVSPYSMIQASAPSATPTLYVKTVMLTNGVAGTAYSATLSAGGGSGSDSWAVTSGSLPTGLSLNGSTGAITGTPTATGTSTFEVTVTDTAGDVASNWLSLTVTSSTFTITTSSLPAGVVGEAYNTKLAASGGSGTDTWSVSSGSLPAGLSLDATTGTISGTPTAATAGTSVTFKVTDTASPPGSATKALTMTVDAALAITTSTLPQGTVGTAYSTTLKASGGTGTDTWSLATGSTLPSGLSLSAAGVISGTPTAAANDTVTVTVSDGESPPATATKSLNLTVVVSPLTVTTTSLPKGTVGKAYSATLAAAGGVGPPYKWSISAGALPAGLTLNKSTGAITGTPTTATTGNITFEVSDSASPADTATKSLLLQIGANSISITTASLPHGTAGSSYSATLSASGGVGAYTWSITTGSLPNGLTLNQSTGVISGTPTGASSSSLGITVTDSASPPDTASKTLSLTVAGVPIAITTSSLPRATLKKAYSTTLAASGGLGARTWTVASGSLPKGLSLNMTTGVISGTPTATGTASVTIAVADAASPPDTASKSFSLTVASSVIVLQIQAAAVRVR